jgi:hypothetical protein
MYEYLSHTVRVLVLVRILIAHTACEQRGFLGLKDTQTAHTACEHAEGIHEGYAANSPHSI